MFHAAFKRLVLSVTLRSLLFNILIVALSLITVSALGTGRADAVTIDFDTFPNSSLVPDGTVITTQYASLGVTFSSPAPAGGPIAGAFPGGTSSAPNVLVGLDPATQAGLLPIVLDIAGLLPNSLNVTLVSVGNATVTATAFASDLVTVLDTVSVTHGPGAGVGLGAIDPITLTGTGIASVRFEITQTGPVLDGFGIDDVVFSPQAVPEPSTSILFGTGLLGVLGYVWRRRQRNI